MTGKAPRKGVLGGAVDEFERLGVSGYRLLRDPHFYGLVVLLFILAIPAYYAISWTMRYDTHVMLVRALNRGCPTLPKDAALEAIFLGFFGAFSAMLAVGEYANYVEYRRRGWRNGPKLWPVIGYSVASLGFALVVVLILAHKC